MNGKKAKALRREVYGQTSLEVPRKYTVTLFKKGDTYGPIKNVGLRAVYQAAKKGLR